MDVDFFSRVPREIGPNLKYRVALRKRAQADLGFRRAMLTACKHDVLFFFAAWCWLYEPRPRKHKGVTLPPIIPFIPWEHQIPAIRTIDENLGFRDIGLEKSRGEGASWIAILFAVHRWLFRSLSAIGFVSRSEAAVDSPDDPDCLFWKVCWELDQLPKWMSGVKDVDYKRTIQDHSLKNLRSGSTITGYAATGDVASGGRKSWFLAQPYSAKIATPTGWQLMGDLAVGDRVIGSNGKACRVVAVHDHGEKDVFRVEFQDGAATRCCADHLWAVQTTGNRHGHYQRVSQRKCKWGDAPYRERYERRPLKEIAKDYRLQNGKWQKAKYHIPITAPVEYDPVELPLHPYLVGAWIGDGYAAEKGSLQLASDDEFIVSRVAEMMPDGVELVKKCKQVYTARRTGKGTNPLKDIFRSLGMLRQSVNKRIPEIYRHGTVEERLELIRGLMDTDGTAQGKPDKPSSYCCLTTISHGLAVDLMEVVQSLGGYCKVKRYSTTCTTGGRRVNGKDCYDIGIALPPGMCPFALPRKVERYKDRTKYLPTRTIVDIRPDGREQCRCITVDAVDHLYLTDGCIVTSNCDELSKFPRGPDFEAMASTQHVTDSRLVVSTPKGSEGAYYELMHEPSNMVKIVLDWKQNPSRNKGLYQMKGGRPVAVDPANPLSPEYDPPCQDVLDMFSRLRRKGFRLEGKQRSPWYDRECDRPGATTQNIAQELDRDYGGSAYRYFGDEFFEAANKTVLRPTTKGMVSYHPETMEPEFHTASDGQVCLWCNLDVMNRPPTSTYVVGADISSGLGGSYTSNSVAQVVDAVTNEQVLEFATNTISPTEFAEHCVAIAKWFHDAYLIWEANGPGAGFTRRVMALKYHNVYYRTVLWKRGNKKTKEMGWWSDTRSKQALFGEVRRRVRSGLLTLRSDMLVKECQQYQVVGEQIVHSLATTTADDSSRGQAHGDRVIAIGVCLHAVTDRPLTKLNVEQNYQAKIPPNSMAARQKEYEDSLRDKEDPWDSRTNWDLAVRR